MTNQDEQSEARYVAMFETGVRGKNYFQFIYVRYPKRYIPPPIIELEIPRKAIVPFVLANDQAAIARAFSTSQQNVSRWLNNQDKEL